MEKINITHIPRINSFFLTSHEKFELCTDVERLKVCGWFVKKIVTKYAVGRPEGDLIEYTLRSDTLKKSCTLIDVNAACTICRKNKLIWKNKLK